MDAISFVRGAGRGRRQAACLNARSGNRCTLLLLSAVLSAGLQPGLSPAAFPTGVAGPGDITALRTPWYYTHRFINAPCAADEQEIIDGIISWVYTQNGVCDVSLAGIDPWPSDPDAGAGTRITFCAEQAVQDFGPLPDISNQNAKPLYHQASRFYLDSTFANTVCSAGDTVTYHDEYFIDRYSYAYCPAGYTYFFPAEPGDESFCRRGAVPERDQGALCATGDALSAGDHIYLGTGKKYRRETDYVDARDGRFVLERHYDSLGNGHSGYAKAGMFGANWNSTFERSIGNTTAASPQSVAVHRASGQRYYFNRADGAWVSNSAVRETLLQTPTGWSYITAEDVREHYDASGRLLSIEFPDGVMQTLSYDAAGRLSRVHTPTGESLTFAYRADGSQDLVESVTDHAGRVWRYRYDDVYSTLEYVLYPDGTPADVSDNPVRQYHYEDLNFPAALTGITDERGIRYSTYAYDSRGRAVSSYLGSGVARVDVDYNGTDDYSDGTAMRTLTNSNGTASTYTTRLQNGVAMLERLSGPGCSTCSSSDTGYRYDPVTNVLQGRTVQGSATEFGSHDVNGNPGFMIEAVGTAGERRSSFTYDPRYFSRITTRTEPSVYAGAVKVTTYDYDDFGNRTAVTVDGFTPDGVPVSRTTRYRYEGPLHQLSHIDGPRTDASDVTTLRYYPDDAALGPDRARLREVEDASGALVRSDIRYSATGKVVSEDRPNGLHLSYTYYPGSDRLETLTEAGIPGSRVTRWTYLATGEVERVTMAAGTPAATSLVFGYDDARRLTRITDGLGNYIEYSLDDEGNRSAATVYDSSGLLRSGLASSFDLYNRLDVSGRANETLDYDHAPDGTLERRTDGEGRITGFSYDALRRLLASTADLGGLNVVTQYGYDMADNLVSVTDPVNGETTYSYDDLGNLLEEHSPDTGATIYTHDAAGNTRTRVDAKDQLFHYHFDALNRLVSLDAPGSVDDIDYSYDSCRNGAGKLCAVAMGGSTVTFGYDVFGNVTDHQSLAYAYDAAGRISGVGYPSGSLVSYRYDAAGQVAQVELGSNGSGTTLASSIGHAPFGPVEHLTFGNGRVLTQALDTAYRLTGQSVPGVLDIAYPEYDKNGNLMARTDSFSADSSFSYDALNRLAAADGGFGARDYGYDLNGNRTRLSSDGQVTVYGYQAHTNRILSETGWSYALDANGNITERLDASGSGEGRLFGYTSHNRLASVSDRLRVVTGKGRKQTSALVDQSLASYVYNGLGQRVSKRLADGTLTRYLYDTSGLLMAELDGAGMILREYVYLDGQLLAVLDPEATPDGSAAGTVVDNGAPPAGWVSKTSNKDYGADYLYSAGGTGSSVRWIPSLTAGTYDVYTWYVQNRKNSRQVPYTISHGGQLDTVFVDQTSAGGSWRLIAQNVTFDGSGSEYIEASDAGGRTTADAVKFVRVAGEPVQATVKVFYVHNDHLGTPQAMTGEEGTVVWRATHDPFGKASVSPSSTRELNVRFPGQYYDEETGLHYNYFRYYDPYTGRYITSDPIGLNGGLNTYIYVGGNPVRWADYFGLDKPGCDGVPDFLESNCMLNMCSKHDYCYYNNKCRAWSWLLPVSACNIKCNLPALGGTLCATGSAVIGHKCALMQDRTPRNEVPNELPGSPAEPLRKQTQDVWEWDTL